MPKPPTARRTTAAAIGMLAFVAHTSQALAVSFAVEIACAADYYSYCSSYDPDGPETRKCMRTNGVKLSRICINALFSAGEITKAEVEAHAKANK